MPRRMRVLIGFGIPLLLGGVYLWLFGVQTFCTLEARYIARKLPVVRNTPVELSDSSASQTPGKTLFYFGFRFDVPWNDIDESRSRVIGEKAVIAFRSGNALAVWRGSPHELVDAILKETNTDPEILRRMYGAQALATDYDFHRIMLDATPDTITPFVPKKQAVSEEMLLVMKGISAPRGSESGIFAVSAGEFKGFQFGRPSKAPTGFSVELYSDRDSLDFIFAPKLHGPTPISQEDVNRILHTLHRIPAEIAAK